MLPDDCSECKKCGQPYFGSIPCCIEKRGGSRPNSGRKKLWEGLTITCYLPLWLKEEFYAWRANRLEVVTKEKIDES